MIKNLNYPFDPNLLLRKKKAIRRDLIINPDLIDKKIAILGGSTTAEVKDMIELFLLNGGIKPIFYESDYNRYFEDIMFPNIKLKDFAPDIIYIHTSVVNITQYPAIRDSQENVQSLITNEVERFTGLWDTIASEYACPIIQNNFELPHYRILGNLDSYDIHGRTNFITQLNQRFSEEGQKRQSLHINDINYLAAWIGLEKWYDKNSWYSYKYAMSVETIPYLANSVTSIIKAIFGKSKKCLVLDLDNTVWGGVIGDEGMPGIKIGKETAVGEAFTEFQEYIKGLKERGVILAVCSKNDEAAAKEGLAHPDSVLKLNDFSSFKANWEAKDYNIREISTQLNIGIDSIVFIDDNPVERDLIRSQESLIAIPEFNQSVTNYINILDKTGYFESVSISFDDLERNSFYAGNAARDELKGRFKNYDEFLKSLDMVAEINSFQSVYLDRITQLTNKTNQFNLTTRRYTFNEIEAIASNPSYIKLYGRLTDKFGDNGLISVMIGIIKGSELHIDLWLMSCRVFKRGMEIAMFDQFVAEARLREIKTIIGYYFFSPKNSIVKDLFSDIGFEKVRIEDNLNSVWSLDVCEYSEKNQFISVKKS